MRQNSNKVKVPDRQVISGDTSAQTQRFLPTCDLDDVMNTCIHITPTNVLL